MPQASQWNTRTLRDSLAFAVPQAEQTLEGGQHREVPDSDVSSTKASRVKIAVHITSPF
jgi:hypothetical protein